LVTKVGGRQEVAIFRQTAANFQQRKFKLWVLKSLILPLNSPNMRDFQPEMCIFGRKFSDKKTFSRQVKIWGGGSCPLPHHDATDLYSAINVMM